MKSPLCPQESFPHRNRVRNIFVTPQCDRFSLNRPLGQLSLVSVMYACLRVCLSVYLLSPPWIPCLKKEVTTGLPSSPEEQNVIYLLVLKERGYNLVTISSWRTNCFIIPSFKGRRLQPTECPRKLAVAAHILISNSKKLFLKLTSPQKHIMQPSPPVVTIFSWRTKCFIIPSFKGRRLQPSHHLLLKNKLLYTC